MDTVDCMDPSNLDSSFREQQSTPDGRLGTHCGWPLQADSPCTDPETHRDQFDIGGKHCIDRPRFEFSEVFWVMFPTELRFGEVSLYSCYMIVTVLPKLHGSKDRKDSVVKSSRNAERRYLGDYSWFFSVGPSSLRGVKYPELYPWL